ncbi:hypothetical protein SAVIM40S_00205 [Streptomyces avidinii]
MCEDGRVVLTGLAAGAAEEALCGYHPVPSAEDTGGATGRQRRFPFRFRSRASRSRHRFASAPGTGTGTDTRTARGPGRRPFPLRS